MQTLPLFKVLQRGEQPPDEAQTRHARAANAPILSDRRQEADADMRRCFRHQFRGDIAEAALIEDEEVETGEV